MSYFIASFTREMFPLKMEREQITGKEHVFRGVSCLFMLLKSHQLACYIILEELVLLSFRMFSCFF